MPRPTPFVHNNTVISLTCAQYKSGRLCIQSFTMEGEPYMTITLNLPERFLLYDEVMIKNYSENTGIVDWLVFNGICHPPHRTFAHGYVEVPVVYLTDSFKDIHSL